MGVTFRLNFVPIVLIIFIFFTCPCLSSILYNVTYNDNSTIDTFACLGTYADGTLLLRLTLKGGSNFAKYRNFRLINPNGTLNFINKFKSPCALCRYYRTLLLNPNYLLIYYKHNDSDNRYLGMLIVDWTGKVTLKKTFGECDNFKIITNEKRDKFLVARYIDQLLHVDEYIINGEHIEVSKNLTFSNIDNITKFNLFSLNETWGAVFWTDSENYFSTIDTEQTLDELNLLLIDIDVDVSDDVFCIGDKKVKNQYYCTFTYNGVLKWISIDYDAFNVRSADLFLFISFDNINTFSMPYVGFLLEVTSNIRTRYLLLNTEIDYLVPNNAFGEWITNNDQYSIGRIIFIVPNSNAIVRVRSLNGTSMTFEFKDLSSKIPKNNPYNNTHIKEVYPSQNDSIPVGTNAISISFLNLIDPTTGTNISVYQHDNGVDILRQNLLCTNPYCAIENNSSSLTIKLLNTTFNVPNATYYVKIDDGFVRYKEELITVPGIAQGKWIINTLPGNKTEDAIKNSKFIIGILRLNLEGTEVFKNLTNVDEQDHFLKQMRIELSTSIPVDSSRIYNIRNNYELDENSNSNLLISFGIDPPDINSNNKNDAKKIFDDLNLLIKTTEFMTPLDMYDHTKYIDKDYGFKSSLNLLQEIKISLINTVKDTVVLVMIIICIILIAALYSFGRYKNKQGLNTIVFKVALSIFDSTNDILFLVTIASKDRLFIPSIIFVAIPFTINIILAFMILSFETTQNSDFREWLENNSKLAAILTLISSGNVELLHMFNSNFGGFEVFAAPFSPLALTWIFWGGLLNIFIEDIPQLTIQIVYATTFTSRYTMIAFLTLITSSIVLFTNIIEYGFRFMYSKKEESTSTIVYNK